MLRNVSKKQHFVEIELTNQSADMSNPVLILVFTFFQTTAICEKTLTLLGFKSVRATGEGNP